MLLHCNINTEIKHHDFLKNKKDNALMCMSLKDNQCLDYDNRPKVCRNYPVNRFLKEGYVRSGCGYKVKKKDNAF